MIPEIYKLNPLNINKKNKFIEYFNLRVHFIIVSTTKTCFWSVHGLDIHVFSSSLYFEIIIEF